MWNIKPCSMHGLTNQPLKHNGPSSVHGCDDRATVVDSSGLMNSGAERQKAGTDDGKTATGLASVVGSYFTEASPMSPDRTW